MKVIHFVLLFPLLFVTCTKKTTEPVPPGNIIWERTFGGKLFDCAFSVQQTSDGGFIIAGAVGGSSVYDFSDVYLIRLNSYGKLIWERSYGPRGTSYGRSVQETSDGGYIIAGSTRLFDTGNEDVYLIKTNSYGHILWSKSIGCDSLDRAYSIQQTFDGGYIISGFTNLTRYADIYVIKTSSEGNIEWTKTFGGQYSGIGYSVLQILDGGYIVAGFTSLGGDYGDVCLLKMDTGGNLVWLKTFGGKGFDKGCSVQQTNEGGFIIAGTTESFGEGWSDVYLIKTDANGNALWAKTYGGTSGDEACSVQQTIDGGYIIVGYTQSFGSGFCNVYLIETDPNGNKLWSKTYNGTGYASGHSVQQTNDGGYIIVGSTGEDVYVLKIR